MTRVLVTGGTGVLGREVVSRLSAKGYTARIMSRSPRPGATQVEWAQAQMLTGEGLSGLRPDVAGPEVLTVKEILSEWQRARGSHKLVLHLPIPGKFSA